MYDPDDYHPKGIWTHTQVIKIMGSPDFELECVEETIFAAEAGCLADVVLEPVTVTGECVEAVTITNDSPYADNNGANASGSYPVGKTIVCYTARDGCGNEDVCCSWVTVRDEKKPTPVCYSGIVMTLGMHFDGYYRVCGPSVINKGSYDNCTPEEDLIMWIEPDTFTCAHLGETEVVMYVEDASGNVNVCSTFVIIQDNMGMCPPGDSLTINGNVHTFRGEMVDAALISNMMTTDAVMTDEEGMFSISSLLADENYTISAEKNDGPKDGLEMEDLVVLSDHLFGEKPLTDPYLLIAADIDNNHDLDLQDFLFLRGLIVDDYEHFSDFSDQRSWRLIDDNFSFANPLEPWDFREEKSFVELDYSQHNQNFVAVKIGDLDYSYEPSGLMEEDPSQVGFRSSGNNEIVLQDKHLQQGEVFTVTLTQDQSNDWKGLDIQLRTEGLVLVNSEVSTKDVVVMTKNEGIRVFGVATNQDWSTDIVSLTFRVQTSGWMSEFISLDQGRAVSDDQNIAVEMRFEGQNYELEIFQNTPNPFVDATSIQFTLQSDAKYTMDFVDATGTKVFTLSGQGVSGMNNVNINRSDLNHSGVYVVRLSSNTATATMKMIVTQ